MAEPLNRELARRLGVWIAGEPAPKPLTMLDHALHWARAGVHVFPGEPHLGRSWVKHWRAEATVNPETIKSWWAQPEDDGHDWYHADIGAVPEKSGHFVLTAHAEQGGLVALAELEEEFDGFAGAAFDYCDRWGSRFVWFKGEAVTSHNELGHGVHVLGPGHFVFMPPSLTPHFNFD